MKKKLESELVDLAHEILKFQGKEDILKMHQQSKELFEKLSVLKFAYENFEGDIPSIGDNSSFFEMLDVAFNNRVSDNIEVDNKLYVNLDEKEDDGIMEPVMEKIKDIVAQIPPETQKVDQILEKSIPQKESSFELEDIAADFIDIPEFEPKVEAEAREQRKSLNDKLKSTLNIGLNDKLAFVKHLFNGSNEDYERVLSQLNTIITFAEAEDFINNIVKPDYNNWVDKDAYQERFMQIIEAKFS